MTVYTLPELPYAVTALEPAYSAKALELHHAKHHASYVKQANETLDRLTEVNASEHPDSLTLRALGKSLAFNVSGHFLHSSFFANLTPGGGGAPEGELAAAISETFRSFDSLQNQLNEAVTSLQGSGWGALIWEPLGNRLLVEQIYDHQANVTPANLPLLVIDGWEHAYYLQYLNEKPKWLTAFWSLVDWERVARRFDAARDGAAASTLIG